MENEILEQFNGTRSARRRIALADDMMAATGKKDVKLDLSVVLKGVTDAVRDSNQLDASERLYGAAVRDDLAKLVTQHASGVSLVRITRQFISFN